MHSNKQNHIPVNSDSEISLIDFLLKVYGWWKFILSKWLLLLAGAIIGGVIGLGYAFYKKPIYTAETSFVLEDGAGAGGMLGQLGGLAGIAGIDVGGNGGLFQGENIIQLYKSRRMIEKTLLSPLKNKTVNDKSLLDRYLTITDMRKNWEDDSGLQKIDFSTDVGVRSRDSIVSIIINDIIKNYLSVTKPDKKLSTIIVQVRSTDEIFSKEFTDKIVSTVNQFYVETKTKKSLESVVILQMKTDSVMASMNSSISKSAEIMDATPNLNSAKQILRTPIQRSQFNAEMNKAILEELVKNLELAKINLLQNKPLIQVIDVPNYPLDVKRLGPKKGGAFGFIIGGIVTLAMILLVTLINDIRKNLVV
ncbi:MAG: lipopolysaccharide biosynthesis protein [Chitinophagaceae bacterium]|nr:lipopolysaccharide biosynthesis protein [Chitinophagaceae bacterium]